MNIELLKNRSQPPGGWSYWCAKGEMDFPGGFAFDIQIEKIREYRASNPSLNLPSDLGAVRHALLLHTYLRLRKQIGLEATMKWFSLEDADDVELAELVKKKLPNLPPEPPPENARPAGITETVKQMANGAQVLADWVGHGCLPVSPASALYRANICRGCKFNTTGNWLHRLAGSVAGFIKEQVALKNQMSLSVEGESELKTCNVCGCHLPLMIWTPIETLAEQTDAATLEKYPVWCWKAEQINQLNYNQI